MKLEGYEVQTKNLRKTFNVITLLNVFIPIGFIVDAATGTILKYSQKQYDFDLKKKSTISLNPEEVEKIEINTEKKLVTISGKE